jgi:hypothetical protein
VDHWPACSHLGFGQLGRERLDVYEALAGAVIDGQAVGTAPGRGLRIEGATIDQVINDTPDTATFRASGFVPVAGQSLTVFGGDTDPNHVLFSGRILETSKVYEGRKDHVAVDLHCIDPTWFLNRTKVLASYRTPFYASDIITDLMNRFARGITAIHVNTGTAIIDAITFTNEDLPACLTAICERIGAYWYVDYAADLHVAMDEPQTAYPITDADPRGSANHALVEDLSQVATRVIGRGGGVGAAIDLPAGSVELPVDEGDALQSWYSPTGGLVEVDTQRITYAGVRGLGATGALVGTGNAPSAALTPTPNAGSSHTVGATYQYSASYATAAGETLAGPVGSILIQGFNPVAPPGVSARSRGPGSYPPGLISPGANGQIVFMVQIRYRGGANGPLGANSATYTWDGNDWEVYLGPRTYYTAPDGSSAYYYPTLEPGGPAAPTANVWIYRWDFPVCTNWMYVSSDGFPNHEGWYEQCACNYGPEGYDAPSAFGSVLVKDLPVSTAPAVTGRKIYRTTANGSALKLLTTIANNTDTSYADTIADAALGVAPPTSDSSGIRDEGQVLVGATQLPVSSTTPFQADMSGGVDPGGWIRVGSMVLRYTGIGSGVLTGIPASGIGSITAVIRYGAQALVQPRLVGIPPSGTGAILAAIIKGEPVIIRIEKQDDDAIAVMADRLKPPGGSAVTADGIIENVISDTRFDLAELEEQIDAHLATHKDPHLTVTFDSRDPSLQVGRTITITMTTPAISGTFRIRRVTITQIAIGGGQTIPYPLRHVEATSQLYTLANLLRRLRGREAGVP